MILKTKLFYFFLLILFLFYFSSISLSSAVPMSSISPSQDTPAQLNLKKGVVSLLKGELDEAEAAFNESLRQDPKLIGSLLGLAQVNLKKGNKKEGKKYLQKALKTAPKNPAVHIAWGRFLFSIKKIKGAEDALKKAVSLNPESTKPYIELGNFYLLGLKQPDKAVRQYRAALKIDPEHTVAKRALEMALSQVKNGKARD